MEPIPLRDIVLLLNYEREISNPWFANTRLVFSSKIYPFDHDPALFWPYAAGDFSYWEEIFAEINLDL
jgi:hypothetical protein